ncbi:10200_t:CDS:1, partial [Dentiscutata heterogama]
MAEDDIDWYFGSLASIPKNDSVALTASSKNSYLDVQTQESKNGKNAHKVDDANEFVRNDTDTFSTLAD